LSSQNHPSDSKRSTEKNTNALAGPRCEHWVSVRPVIKQTEKGGAKREIQDHSGRDRTGLCKKKTGTQRKGFARLSILRIQAKRGRDAAYYPGANVQNPGYQLQKKTIFEGSVMVQLAKEERNGDWGSMEEEFGVCHWGTSVTIHDLEAMDRLKWKKKREKTATT